MLGDECNDGPESERAFNPGRRTASSSGPKVKPNEPFPNNAVPESTRRPKLPQNPSLPKIGKPQQETQAHPLACPYCTYSSGLKCHSHCADYAKVKRDRIPSVSKPSSGSKPSGSKPSYSKPNYSKPIPFDSLLTQDREDLCSHHGQE